MTRLALAAVLAFPTAAAPASAGQTPEWVKAGSGYVDENGAKVLAGVGFVSNNVRNRRVAVALAGMRACGEVGTLMEAFVRALTDGYIKAAPPPDPKGPGVSARNIDFFKDTVPQPRVTARWRETDGTEVSRCETDLDDVLASVRASTTTASPIEDFVLQNADKIFAALAAKRKVPSVDLSDGQGGRLGAIAAMAFSADGRLLLASDGNRAALWDVPSQVLRWARPADADLAAFSTDGGLVGSVGWDGLAQAWDAASGASRSVGSNAYVLRLSKAYSGDGGQQVIDSLKAFCRSAPPGLPLQSSCLGRSYIASTSTGGGSGEEEQIQLSCRFSGTVVGGTWSEVIQATMTATAGGGFNEAFSRDRRLVSAGRTRLAINSDGRLVFGDGAQAKSATVPGVQAAAVSDDGKAALIGAGRVLSLWDAAKGVLVASWTLPGDVTALAFAPGGRAAAMGLGSDGDNLRLLSFRSERGKTVYDKTGALSSFGLLRR